MIPNSQALGSGSTTHGDRPLLSIHYTQNAPVSLSPCLPGVAATWARPDLLELKLPGPGMGLGADANSKMNGQGPFIDELCATGGERPKATRRPGAFRLWYLALFFAVDPWVVPRPLRVLHSPTGFPLVPNALWQSNQVNISLKENSFTKQASGVLDGIALLRMEIAV